jgi:hypothetical protein
MFGKPVDRKLRATVAKPSMTERRVLDFKGTRLLFLLNILIICLFVTVLLFIQATYAAESRADDKLPLTKLLKLDISTTLAVLRTSQGALSTFTALAISDTFVLLQWKRIASPTGLSCLNLLALSPTTGHLGTLSLVLSSVTRLPTRLWALLR